MCNQPGMPVMGYQEGGEIRTGTIAGQEVAIPGAEEDIPGITELAYGLMAQGVDVPEQQIADFTPAQLAAFGAAEGGVGAYLPYLQRSGELTEQGVGVLQDAIGGTRYLAGGIPGEVRPGQESLRSAASRAGASVGQAQRSLGESGEFGLASARQGIAGLAGTGGMFSPEAVAPFMSQYEDAAVQQALRDIARQGDIEEQGLRAQAVQQGAFGGSRQAVAEQELGRNVLEQQGRTAAQMRAAGFENAAQRAQQAFEQSRARQQTAAQLTGQLGSMGSSAATQAAQSAGQLGVQGAQAAGNLGLQASQLGLSGIQAGLGAQQQQAGLGQGIAGLGQQTVGLGQLGQQLGLQDINTLMSTGGAQQRQAQGGLDIAYQNQYQQLMQPYQQLAFASDIFTGAPSGQMTSATQPGPSVGSQLMGAGLGLYGLSQSGMFS